MFTTNLKPSGTIATFATFRVSGDRLDPDRVSDILATRPTTAYRKGEPYFAGSRTGYILGRTGLWYLSTKGLVPVPDAAEHLTYLIRLVYGSSEDLRQVTELRELMDRDGLEASASLFWHGGPGAQEPAIPQSVERTIEAIPAQFERDFDKD